LAENKPESGKLSCRVIEFKLLFKANFSIMHLIITGSPGVGKTSAARIIGKKLGCAVLNEKQLALENGIGKFDAEEDELVIPLQPFARALNALFSGEKSVIVEGHLLCEIKSKADFAALIREDPSILEERLRARGYGEEKVQDNVFCESTDYCKKRLLRNCPEERVVEVLGGKSIKETSDRILKGLREKGAEL
jgi:adenylate kinase